MAEIDWHGEELTREIEQEASNRMFRTCVIILGEAQRSMRQMKHGKDVPHKRLKSGKISAKQWSRRWQKTRRSAPGESPAVQSGDLWRSLSFMGGGVEKLSLLRWRIGTNVKYGKRLAVGTKRMKARPFLKPAAEKMKAKIEALFAREKM